MAALKDGKPVISLGMVRCPAHPDRNPSLMVGRDADGRLMLKCMAGCSAHAVYKNLARRQL
jgi:hypothetical protein